MTVWPVAEADLLALAAEAGALVRGMQGSVSLKRKAGGSPYTEADIAANRLISDRLRKWTPDIPVVAEEDDHDELQRIIARESTYWLVDPLDVTMNYIDGGNGYSVNIALLRDGVPALGVLEFPGMGLTYHTGPDGKAYKREQGGAPQPIRVKDVEAEGYRRAPISTPVTIAMHPVYCGKVEETPGVRHISTTGQHRACLVAEGKALLCSERAGFRAWDTAPTFAILRGAGGDIWQEDGQRLNFLHRMELPVYHVAHPLVLETLIGQAERQERY